MHCSVTWDCEPAGDHPAVNEAMGACFSDRNHVRVFDQTYVVQLPGNGAYETLQLKLMEAARSFENPVVRFLLSPLQERGVYNGRMSDEAAGHINTLAE